MDDNGRSATSRDELVARALQVRAEAEAFNARWTPLGPGEAMPGFSWQELERQLVDMAPTDLQAELVHSLIERVKTYAALKPPEMVLRQILSVAALVLDESTDTTG